MRRARQHKAWSQEDLAFECGLHRTYISGIERGVRNPTVLILAKIADALGVEPSGLFKSDSKHRRLSRSPG
ncbi:MAG: helix-turn-helix transcriptional regulator [Alphaproteobacteria bacterium]